MYIRLWRSCQLALLEQEVSDDAIEGTMDDVKCYHHELMQIVDQLIITSQGKHSGCYSFLKGAGMHITAGLLASSALSEYFSYKDNKDRF